MDKKSKNYWVNRVIPELEKININIEPIENKHFSEEKFLNICKIKIEIEGIWIFEKLTETMAITITPTMTI